MKLMLSVLVASFVYVSVIPAAAATYWNFFRQDPSQFTEIASVYFTYNTLEDMLSDTNRQDRYNHFGDARSLTASGFDGTTYWNFFRQDPSQFTEIASVYFTYNTLEDMLSDTNRQDRYNHFGDARSLTASGFDGTTYWNFFRQDPSQFTEIASVYFTYNTLEDMLSDTNRQDRYNHFGDARSLTASGFDGTTYWNFFRQDPSQFTEIASVYFTYNTLEDMLSDTNRQDRYNLFGDARTLSASGSSILKTAGPITPIPLPASLPLLLCALGLLASRHFRARWE